MNLLFSLVPSLSLAFFLHATLLGDLLTDSNGRVFCRSSLSLLIFCIGYVIQYRSLQAFLSQQPFYNHIELIPREDRGVTGNFEITIGNQLVHSKRTAGQGKCTNSKERTMLVEFIQEYLDDNL
jgi:hypothetical protein